MSAPKSNIIPIIYPIRVKSKSVPEKNVEKNSLESLQIRKLFVHLRR